MSFHRAIHPDDRDRVREALADQADGEYDEQYRVIQPDGEIRWVRDRAFPIEGDDGGDARFEDDEVRTTTDLNGRDRPGLDTEIAAVLEEGTTATVMNGPETVDDITWWGLHVPDEEIWVLTSGTYLELVVGEDRRDPLPFDVETDLTEPIAVTGSEIDAAIAAERS